MINASLSIEVHQAESDEKVKIIILVGSLDTISVPKAEEVINPLITEDGICLIVDCNKLAYMNSTGLALLIRYQLQMQRRNGSFKIVAPTANIKEIIDVSGAIKLLEIFKNEQEAMISWKRR